MLALGILYNSLNLYTGLDDMIFFHLECASCGGNNHKLPQWKLMTFVCVADKRTSSGFILRNDSRYKFNCITNESWYRDNLTHLFLQFSLVYYDFQHFIIELISNTTACIIKIIFSKIYIHMIKHIINIKQYIKLFHSIRNIEI